MRQSQLFTKTRKEAPSDEVAKNAQLLIRAGFVHKEMAGVYSYLPLGLRVLNKINNIIREEMNAIGGVELFLTALQPKEKWEKTERFNEDVWFKTKLANGTELGLGFTHEEALTNIMRDHINSFRDLPAYPYQIQTKFRNEVRSKSGIMRGREFLMKDLYSFNETEEDLEKFYEQAAEAYMRIFKRAGIGDKTYRTFAAGGTFSKFSDEFQTLSDAGEDTIYIDEEKNIAINEEVYTDEVIADLGLNKNKLRKEKSIEVGNIFKLGTRFSEALDLKYKTSDGEAKPVIMGSYGIGPGRLMGTVVELTSDENGLVWPEEVAPFDIHLVEIASDNPEVKKATEALYKKLVGAGKEVLYDDRDIRAGEKFSDSDLIGIPTRVVIGEKTLAEGKFEVKRRRGGETTMLTETELLK